MIVPDGIRFVDHDVRLYWLLKQVRDRIDLNWMSIAPDRRDFPAGTEGSYPRHPDPPVYVVDQH